MCDNIINIGHIAKPPSPRSTLPILPAALMLKLMGGGEGGCPTNIPKTDTKNRHWKFT